MKRVILALALMMLMGLAACDGNVTNPVGTNEPLVTEDVKPGENTLPGSGVPTAPQASASVTPEVSATASPEASALVSPKVS